MADVRLSQHPELNLFTPSPLFPSAGPRAPQPYSSPSGDVIPTLSPGHVTHAGGTAPGFKAGTPESPIT